MSRRDLQQHLHELLESTNQDDVECGVCILAETLNIHGSWLSSPIIKLGHFSCEYLNLVFQKLTDESSDESKFASLKILAVLGM